MAGEPSWLLGRATYTYSAQVSSLHFTNVDHGAFLVSSYVRSVSSAVPVQSCQQTTVSGLVVADDLMVENDAEKRGADDDCSWRNVMSELP